MLTISCPPRETLLGFTVGDLAEEQIESVADHLESCKQCDETVALLEERSDTLIGQLRTPDVKAQFADEREFQEAVAGAIALAGNEMRREEI
ncbi:MAG: hypothetical protein IH987_20005, partial [Planctomycetes bacterium]|nr:hypothetical protein [Planctomycetota bacterium]